MKNSLAVNELYGFEKLIHVVFDFLLVELFVLDQALIHILLHKFED